MENKKKYFKGLIDKSFMEGRKEAEILKKLENRNNMRSAPIKADDYTSAIDPSNDRMIVKSGTEKINTNPISKLTSEEDFSKKLKDLDMSQKIKATMAQAVKSGDTGMIEKLKLLASKVGSKVPAIAGVAAVGSALMNPSESMASDLASSAADMATPTGAEVSGTGFNADSLEGRFERGLLSPEEMREFYKKQALIKMRGE
jgi:hypothetical protein